ncbi:MAG: hypothetical protein C5B53_10955 [Candidatus Melainabacteria bacterium]|nr:MAG: hypothetical protein C5B53_10955 [Candidatus Melainabacteria bacterium]
MQDQRKRISTLMGIEIIAIGTLMAVTGWLTRIDMEIQHTALMRDGAAKLLHQVKDAKLLLVTYSASRIPALKEWCKSSGEDLSQETDSPIWRHDQPMVASDNPDQWKEMRQLSEPITSALANPDSVVGKAEVIVKLDALEKTLRSILDKEADAWEASFHIKPYVELAQWVLMIVILVVFNMLRRSVKPLIDNQTTGAKEK